MLIRFVLGNISSFDENKEFNMLPKPRLGSHLHHKLSYRNVDILKLASIYGANGAGKSNLINALDIFQKTVLEKSPIENLKQMEFKFNAPDKSSKQTLAIEFIQDEIPFYYAIELSNNNIVITEELYISGLGKNKDQLIFERKTDKDKKTKIRFREDFENNEKNQILKNVLLEEFVKPNKLVLKLLSNRENELLRETKLAYKWFKESLVVLKPDSRPIGLVQKIDKNDNFKSFAEKIVCSFNVGVNSLSADKSKLNEIMDENTDNYNDILMKLKENPNNFFHLRSKKGDEILIVNENDEIVAKYLTLKHIGKNNKIVDFSLNDESDGTVRLLDFVPAFNDIILSNKVYVVDEIERSIHPLLIKRLITKFSDDNNSKGQLIFSTHESSLLDQEIFRQDEIWFVEKDLNGASDIYSLSDFKVHNTKNIQKGYLNGRYGSIPFLSNLSDLNWNNYDIEK